jgi:hypothetical protein
VGLVGLLYLFYLFLCILRLGGNKSAEGQKHGDREQRNDSFHNFSSAFLYNTLVKFKIAKTYLRINLLFSLLECKYYSVFLSLGKKYSGVMKKRGQIFLEMASHVAGDDPAIQWRDFSRHTSCAGFKFGFDHPGTSKQRCLGQAEALRFVAGAGLEPATFGL